jgi:GT2 family glycosyltransferase
LEKLQSQKKNLKVIFNKENKGFPAGINQGILGAKTENIIIANNDIVVTENWLEKMIQKAESDSEIGIVGPISNSVSGVQLDKNAKYNSIEEMHKYAKSVSASNKGLVEQFPRVAFLCTLIKKEVIEKIGGLDERFSPGNFEDDDFCLRAQLAGYKTVIAKDVFIHHYGSVSFKQNGENEYGKRLKINEQKIY